jgi:hypothetical protein
MNFNLQRGSSEGEGVKAYAQVHHNQQKPHCEHGGHHQAVLRCGQVR